MGEVFQRDKRKGKAIVDETDDQFNLPQSIPTVDFPKDDAPFYIARYGTQRMVTEAAHTYSSAGLQKKVFVIRNKELDKVLGKEDKKIKNIHSKSGATIGLLSDAKTKITSHSYLELLGTPEEVIIAESLIVKAIKKTYAPPLIPPVLMPPNYCHHNITIPLSKSGSLLDFDGENILKMEMLSGAWIEVAGIIKADPLNPPPDNEIWRRVVNIFGNLQQITSALSMIQEVPILGKEHVEAENDWEDFTDEMEAAEDADYKGRDKLEDFLNKMASAEEAEYKGSGELEDEMQHYDEQEVESENKEQMAGVKGKSILEETDHHFQVPKSVPKVNSTNDDDRCYIKLFGTLPEIVRSSNTDSSAVEQVERKLFRIRNTDLQKVLGQDDNRITGIHRGSGATIGILSDTQIKIHRQSYLELLGTPDQVAIAELLIEDTITETYVGKLISTSLMPSDILHRRVTFPIYKAGCLMGMDGNNIHRMEIESGAWIEVDTVNTPPGGKAWERVVTIFGSLKQVSKATILIYKTLSEDPFVDEFDSVEEEEYKKRADLEDEIRQFYELEAAAARKKGKAVKEQQHMTP